LTLSAAEPGVTSLDHELLAVFEIGQRAAAGGGEGSEEAEQRNMFSHIPPDGVDSRAF
jgi:hypothetical protein